MRPGLGSRARAGRADRRGAVLVLVSLFLFGALALIATALEIGAARYAQSKLQDAADVAAREGLRLRDLDLPNSDRARREAARLAVARTFDADLDPATLDALRLGAGGFVEVDEFAGIGGAGGFDPESLGRFVPDLAANLENAAFGDLVAGRFDPTQPAFENADYQRSDFVPATPESASDAEAFLVRTRRTPLDAPLDRIPGASTAGPPLPLLFGLGTTLQSVDPAAYDPRRDGIAVRATSIATARPALEVAVGPQGAGLLEYARAADGTAGVWSLDVGFWRTLGEGTSVLLESAGTTVSETVSGLPVGAIVDAQLSLTVSNRRAPSALGLAPDPLDLVSSRGPRGIVLTRTEPDGALRVVAFGALEPLNVAVDGTLGQFRFEARVAGPSVAPSYATVQSRTAWLALETGGPLEVPGLREDFDNLENRLQAAILVR